MKRRFILAVVIPGWLPASITSFEAAVVALLTALARQQAPLSQTFAGLREQISLTSLAPSSA